MSSTTQDKAIQPGSMRYTYYRSSVSHRPVVKQSKPHHYFRNTVLLLAALIAIPVIYNALGNKTVAISNADAKNNSSSAKPAPSTSTQPAAAATTSTAAVSPCASNTLSQLILVSISERHLWACAGGSELYNSAVVTGDEQYADTLTPVGTYHIYAKQTDTRLTGSDENGSWNDFVHYWMPFLDNQYGAYGFHDATWRSADAFGNISPDSANASNGCVELPLATAKWLYDWDRVGTTVTIEN